MNIIVENLLKKIKSKPPGSWDTNELEDFTFAIGYIYTYLPHTKEFKEDREQLKRIYSKIVEIVNGGRRGTVINPGYLNSVDRDREKEGGN